MQHSLSRKGTPMKLKTTLSTAVAVLCLVGVAEARESTQNYTCSGAKQLVKSKGAIVLNTKNSNIYKRFVANRSYCSIDQIVKFHSVPTKAGRCLLKICVDYEPKEDIIIE